MVSAGLILLSIGIASLYYSVNFEGRRTQDEILEIPKGTSAQKTCEILSEAQITPHPWVCLLGGTLFGNLRSLQAGEYEISKNASFLDAVKKITRGEVVVYQITMPEGLTSYEIVERLKTLPKLEGEISEVPNEGSLFPSTYAYKKGEARGSLIQKMQTEMTRLTTQLWENRNPGLLLQSREEMISLAALIEKETALAPERPLVSAVFYNRLKLGMPLQCDPTVVYAISNGTGKLDRELSRADLKVEHPLNTYVNKGLPPGAIANPGIAALKAALNPAPVAYLYFVADGTGGHHFSETLQAHQKNHQAWRKIRNK